MKITFPVIFLILTCSAKGQNPDRIQALYSSGEYEKVVEEGRRILEQDPGNATANFLTGRALADLKQSANRRNSGLKELMSNSDAYSDDTIYPIGGALMEFLLSQNDPDRLKALLKEQTWDKLIELYGESAIQEFEEQIKTAPAKGIRKKRG